jgi:hypothetical protein
LLPAGGDHELRVVKELLVALVHVHDAEPPAAVRVPLELVHGVFERGGDGRALGLDHDHGDAVHEQHDVGDDVLVGLARRAGDLELADRPEGVVLRVVPVDEVDGAAPALLPALDPLDDGALEQQLGGLLVGLQQLRRPEALEGVDGLRDAGVVEPGVAVRVEVDAAEGLP